MFNVEFAVTRTEWLTLDIESIVSVFITTLKGLCHFITIVLVFFFLKAIRWYHIHILKTLTGNFILQDFFTLFALCCSYHYPVFEKYSCWLLNASFSRCNDLVQLKCCSTITQVLLKTDDVTAIKRCHFVLMDTDSLILRRILRF